MSRFSVGTVLTISLIKFFGVCMIYYGVEEPILFVEISIIEIAVCSVFAQFHFLELEQS